MTGKRLVHGRNKGVAVEGAHLLKYFELPRNYFQAFQS